MVWYNPFEKNQIVSEIIGGDENNYSWLNSQYVGINEEEDVFYGLRIACSTYITTHRLFTTTTSRETLSYALHPVISFNIKRLDISDTTKTGTEAAPWEIK